MQPLRKWQQECLDAFIENSMSEDSDKVFVIEACTAAGKSRVAAELSSEMLNNKELFDIHFVIVMVPWKSIQGEITNDLKTSGMIKTFSDMEIEVRDRFFIRSARLVEQPVPSGLDGVVTTNHEIMNQEAVDVLTTWKRKGFKFAVIFDEIHHKNETHGSWGYYAEQIQSLAEKTIVLSGTYFRTDGQPIKFVQYDKNDRPITNYQYSYRTGVADKVVRPSTCRFIDVELDNVDRGERVIRKLSTISPNETRWMNAAKRDVLHPEGECVHMMIQEIYDHIKKTRSRFRNAAVLFTCRPGKDRSSEDKYIHQIANKIRQYTRIDPVVVTHKDRYAQGKIDAFRNGTEPFLVAVNMISEGVDIPRIRCVAMMRYISSEQMFRQMVGRAIRYTNDEDGTAALMFMPKFKLMKDFGSNLEKESLSGLKDLTCKQCGQYPCECPCNRCHQRPCTCPPGSEGGDRPPGIENISATPEADGGVTFGRSVDEPYIQHAINLGQISPDLLHANCVQLGNALQIFNETLKSAQSQGEQPSPVERRRQMVMKVRRLMSKLAGKSCDGDFKRCWTENLLRPYGVDWKTAQNSWSIGQLENFTSKLADKLAEAYKNGN